jgi:hypothetical protein
MKSSSLNFFSFFFSGEIFRVEDAVIRYLNRKTAGSDAPGSA